MRKKRPSRASKQPTKSPPPPPSSDPSIPPLLQELLNRKPSAPRESPAQPAAYAKNNRAVVHSSKSHIFALLNYTPHPGQQAFHDSRARFKVLAAGARFGKSLAAAREIVGWLSVPGSRGWIVAPSYRLGEKEFRYLAQDAVTLFEDRATVTHGGVRGPSAIHIEYGGEAHVLSTADPDALLGEELDWVILSEASRLADDVWPRYLRARLATRGGVAVMPSTPAGFNWLHEAYLRGVSDDPGEWQSFHYRTEDNPLIPPEEIEEARKTLPYHTFAEQFGGEFVQPEGNVFPSFDPTIHVIDNARLDKLAPRGIEIPVYGGIDWGFTDPFVLLTGRMIGGRLVITHELVLYERVSAERRKKIREQGQAALMRNIFCDPSRPDDIQELYLEDRLNTIKGDNSIIDGIQAIWERLALDEGGVPKMLIHKRCVTLIRDMTRYKWGTGRSNGHPLPNSSKDDHSIDALRYLCMGLRASGPSAVQLR